LVSRQVAAACSSSPAIQALASGVGAPSVCGTKTLAPVARETSDWWMCQPLATVLARRGLGMKLACRPRAKQTSLTRVRNRTVRSAWVSGSAASKVNSNWLGPISISTERGARPIASAARRRASSRGSTSA